MALPQSQRIRAATLTLPASPARSISQPLPMFNRPAAPDAVRSLLGLTPTGTSPLVYSTIFSSSTFSTGTGIAVDASGAAYVVGAAGSGFPTTGGAIKSTLTNEENNGFVLKLAPTTGSVVYSTYLGGTTPAGTYPVMDTALTVALPPGCASNCNAYVGGSTDSSDFPTAPVGGALQPNNGGSVDPFDGFVCASTRVAPSWSIALISAARAET